MTIRLYNLLFERTTNRAVQGFIKFFTDHMLENLTEPKYSEERHLIRDPNGLGYPYFILYVKPSYNPSYEEYKKINPDDNGLIIRNQRDLEDFLSEIKIQVFPKSKNKILGSMSTDGVLSIFNRKWIDEKEKPSPEEIKAYIKEVKTRLIPHEIGHYINAWRSSHRTGVAVDRREKTRGKNLNLFRDGSSQEYVESTEEIQARIAEFIIFLENLLETPVDQKVLLNGVELELLYALAKKDFERFYDAVFRTQNFGIMYDSYKKGTLSEKTFKRVVGDRLWKIYEEYKDKDLPIYGAILSMSYLTPPPL